MKIKVVTTVVVVVAIFMKKGEFCFKIHSFKEPTCAQGPVIFADVCDSTKKNEYNTEPESENYRQLKQ